MQHFQDIFVLDVEGGMGVTERREESCDPCPPGNAKPSRRPKPVMESRHCRNLKPNERGEGRGFCDDPSTTFHTCRVGQSKPRGCGKGYLHPQQWNGREWLVMVVVAMVVTAAAAMSQCL